MNNPADDVSQAEKRRILADDRKVRATFHSIASAGMDDERGGRFSALNKPSVTGSDPTVMVPRQPLGSPWHSDPLGKEAPLGFSVEDQPPTGEAWEVQKSIDDLASSPSAHGGDETPTSLVVGEGKSVGVKPKWRRI
jgi:hypothetical protein